MVTNMMCNHAKRVCEQCGMCSGCKLVYLRCGDLPENGRSRNYRTNELEAGVSVYEGILRDGKAMILLPSGTPGACVTASGAVERPVYMVGGEVVGRGSDGEPVLANVQVVKRVELSGAEKNVTSDLFAGRRPLLNHQLKHSYCVPGEAEHTITCTCGLRINSPDYDDAMALFDFHTQRMAFPVEAKAEPRPLPGSIA